jgi:hypothetical protein
MLYFAYLTHLPPRACAIRAARRTPAPLRDPSTTSNPTSGAPSYLHLTPLPLAALGGAVAVTSVGTLLPFSAAAALAVYLASVWTVHSIWATSLAADVTLRAARFS